MFDFTPQLHSFSNTINHVGNENTCHVIQRHPDLMLYK